MLAEKSLPDRTALSRNSADGRKGVAVVEKSDAWESAQDIANVKQEHDSVYIIDVCESGDRLYLVEMNPFSGADLYCCDTERIIEAIEAAIAEMEMFN